MEQEENPTPARPTQPVGLPASSSLPKRVPGGHRTDDLGQRSVFVHDRHEAWTSNAVSAARAFLRAWAGQ